MKVVAEEKFATARCLKIKSCNNPSVFQHTTSKIEGLTFGDFIVYYYQNGQSDEIMNKVPFELDLFNLV